MTIAFPLAWPATFPRSQRRERSRFKTTLTSALKNVQTSLRLFGRDSGKAVRDVVLSSNVTLGSENPSDPAVAVYFTWDGLPVCIPVDRYDRVEHNLQAVHHIIEARRTELRHGSLTLVRASFAGFTALPPPSTSCWAVLGLKEGAGIADIHAAHRRLTVANHPDKGGSTERMAEINAARDEALRRAGG